MSDQKTRSAEGEPWWPEFVAEFGKTPLRELARRFETNPRRLRRAAQRSGLTEDPEKIETVVDRLGACADITLADELGVTAEVIAGARRRRQVAAFDPTKAPPKPPKKEAAAPEPASERDSSERPSSERPSDERSFRDRPPRDRPPRERGRAERKARYRPDPDAVVVVRRRPTPEITPAPLPSQGLANLTRALQPRGEAGGSTPRPLSGTERPRRRRIISKPSSRDDSSEPEPVSEAPVLPRLRKPRKPQPFAASAVRIVAAEEATDLVDELVEDLMVDMVETERARPKVFKAPPPAPRSVSAPVTAPEPSEVVAVEAQAPSADAPFWIATVHSDGEDRDIVIRADTVVEAARIASGHGTIARLNRADLL